MVLRLACVAMSTLALSSVCLPFVNHLADHGKIYCARNDGYYKGPLKFLLEQPMVSHPH